jgi:hypothetical protein
MLSINGGTGKIDDCQIKSIKKAEPFLTLPEGEISLYEVYEISNHSRESATIKDAGVINHE